MFSHIGLCYRGSMVCVTCWFVYFYFSYSYCESNRATPQKMSLSFAIFSKSWFPIFITKPAIKNCECKLFSAFYRMELS